jgi:N-methylhydantoinase B
MPLDPALIEIMSHKFAATAEEMVAVIHRTSRSTFVKEALDFSVGVCDVKGKVFAFPRAANTFAIDRPCTVTIAAVPDVEPGDVICTNDPYASGGLVTHVPDLHLLKPFFHRGRVVAYGWCFAHFTDVGGSVPSSMSPSNTEIFQEGIRIPPLKLVNKGEMNEDVVRLFSANSRIPETNLGDIRAMLGALEAGERRIAEIIERYSVAIFLDAQKTLQDLAAAKARAVLRRIPDGSYDFWDYMDDDLVSRFPVRLRVCMTVADGLVHLDLTGTDPQSKSAYNCPTLAPLHHWLVLKLTIFMMTHDKTIPLNAGMVRPISCTNPPGTIMNAEFPDAVAFRTLAAIRFNDAVTGALLKASDVLMPAPAAGCMSTMVLSEYEPGAIRPTVHVIQPMRGGMGAYKGRDGVDARDVTINNMRNHPIESIETECGVIVREYDIGEDSGGPGRWRGGVGQKMTLEITRNGGTLLIRGSDRFRFTAWGVAGGRPSAPYRLVVNEGKADERLLTKVDRLPVDTGDTVSVNMPGAGGFGDAYLRNLDAVLSDVENGFVSRQAAATNYGVAITETGLDETATKHLRLDRVQENMRADFDFGCQREAWETVFDDDAMLALNRRLYALPKSARYEKRQKVFEYAVPDLPPTGQGSVEGALANADAARRRLARAMDEVLGPEGRTVVSLSSG